jgi:cytochrome oxidase Cu insertion factor (SCO1/SenC/PrrC family)
MSDELPNDQNKQKTNSPSGAMHVAFIVNGVVCCLLIVALVAFGMKGKQSGNEAGSAIGKDRGVDVPNVKPLATATDSVEEDDDDNNGKPKTVKIEMKWSPEGIADFEFTERSGKTVSKQDLLGHPWIAAFIFSNCAGPCYKVSSAMRQLQDEFLNDTDLRLVSFTVDSERDTPEVLTKYAQGFKADPNNWLFLTGEKAKIYHLIWGSFLMPVQEETGERRKPGFEFIHTTNVLLVDEKGIVQGKWSSTDEAEFGKMRRELRKRLRKGTETDERVP